MRETGRIQTFDRETIFFTLVETGRFSVSSLTLRSLGLETLPPLVLTRENALLLAPGFFFYIYKIMVLKRQFSHTLLVI